MLILICANIPKKIELNKWKWCYLKHHFRKNFTFLLIEHDFTLIVGLGEISVHLDLIHNENKHVIFIACQFQGHFVVLVLCCHVMQLNRVAVGLKRLTWHKDTGFSQKYNIVRYCYPQFRDEHR